jgi:hypothetical protein
MKTIGEQLQEYIEDQRDRSRTVSRLERAAFVAGCVSMLDALEAMPSAYENRLALAAEALCLLENMQNPPSVQTPGLES